MSIDNQAVTNIHREAVELCEAQGKNLTISVQQQIGHAGMPANMASQLSGTIARAMSGIEARIYRKLSTKRDEQLMAAQLKATSEAVSAGEEAGQLTQLQEGPNSSIPTTRHEGKDKPWTRDRKIGAIAAILVVLAIVVSVVTPEIRQKMGLEKKQESISLKPTPIDSSTAVGQVKEQPAEGKAIRMQV